MFTMKDTQIDEIFTVNLTLSSKCQIDDEDFFNFCGLLRKYEFCPNSHIWSKSQIWPKCHIWPKSHYDAFWRIIVRWWFIGSLKLYKLFSICLNLWFYAYIKSWWIYIHCTFFCQNASVWNRFQLYIDDKGKLWVTNTKKG